MLLLCVTVVYFSFCSSIQLYEYNSFQFPFNRHLGSLQLEYVTVVNIIIVHIFGWTYALIFL